MKNNSNFDDVYKQEEGKDLYETFTCFVQLNKKFVYLAMFESIPFTYNNNFYDIDNYITKYDSNLHFISSPKDPRYASKISSRFLNLLFNRVCSLYDVILVDTNHFLNEINLVTFDHSSQILYLINNNSMNLKNMRSMISIFSDMHMKDYKIILYEAKDKNKVIFKKFDIKNLIKDNIDYIISTDFYNKDLDKYIMSGNIVDNNKFLKGNRVFLKIAKDLIK